jgi:oligoendopeptidase F
LRIEDNPRPRGPAVGRRSSIIREFLVRFSRSSAAQLALVFVTLVLSPTLVCAEPEQDKWNLADLYATRADWDADTIKMKAQLDALARCKGQLGRGVARFKACFDLADDIQRRFGRIEVYGSEWHNQDTSEPVGTELDQKADLLQASFGEVASFIAPEVIALGRKRIDAYLAQDKSLAIYRHGLDDILRRAPHTLDAKTEGVIATFGLTNQASQTTYTLLTTADLPWPTVTLSDGTKVTLDQSAYTKYRAVQNRADRKLVMDSFFGAMKQFEHTFGSTFYGQAKTDLVNAKLHGFPDVVSSKLFGGNVPVAVYDTLISAANANLPTLHRYFRLRAKMLGVTDLHYYDIYPPLLNVDRTFTVDEAKKLTLEAVAPLGDDYVAAMKNGFDHRWMDAYPRPHKLSGAHMAGYAYDVHPYVLLNFNNDYEGVTTIAHEWGHALHTVEANKAQPFTTADYPIFVAEIASTFNENMLLKHMLDISKTDDERLLYLGSALENLRGTFFRQAMFAEFERTAHAKVDAGESLSGEDLTKIYADILKRYHGVAQGVMTIDDVDTIEWAYIPHFYNAFYVFQYATSIAASSLFSDEVLANEPGARERYLGLLRAGGSGYAYDLVKKAGVDLATPAPYASIVARMNAIMDDIEKIEAKKGGKS